MIFPIGDDQVKGGHFPIVSYALLAANILVFLYQMSLGTAVQAFNMEFGSIPVEIMQGDDLFTLFTSIFMHGGIMHLVGNMLFLFVFADNIEATIGSPKFAAFYLIGGMAAHAAHILYEPASTMPTVGASGAISAVMGAYLIMFPKSRIKMLVIVLFRSFYISALFFLVFWIGQQLVSGLGLMGGDGSNVAWWAHIGGFAFGVLAGLFFRKTEKMLPVVDNTVRPQQIRQTRAQRRAARPPGEKYPGYL